MQTAYVSPKIDRTKEPTAPGIYWAREISHDLADQVILTWPGKYKVVEGVPNPRGHRLLVETGVKQPHHRSLNCYLWGEPTEKEKDFLSQLLNQR